MFKLNYNGKLDNQIGVVMGPNTLGERLVVTSQHFDINQFKTTLELRIYRGE